MILAACATPGENQGSDDWLRERLSPEVRSPSELETSNPMQPIIGADVSDDQSRTPTVEILQQGAPRSFGARPENGRSGGSGSFRFDFVGADLLDVIRAVLGDMLGRSYAVDESVRGTITLQSADLVSGEEALSILTDVLEARGFEIADGGATLQVRPIPSRSGGARRVGIEDNTRFVKLYHISASEALAVLQPLVSDRVTLRVMAEQNLILVSGGNRDIEHVLELTSVLDVEVLSGKAVAILNPRFASAGEIAKELQSIFESANSQQGYRAVRISPIQRLNAVLVIAETQDLVQQAATWMRRLDRADNKGERQLNVYAVQNGRATDVAEVLGKLFGSSGDGAALAGGPPGENFRPRITADDRNNVLLVFATQAEMRVLQSALQKLDVPALQVLIEAVVAEVLLTDELRYGVQWFFEDGNFSTTLSTQNSGAVAGLFPGFSALLAGSDIRATLNALESITEVQVVSSPRMMVVNNETARLQVGDEVPIATQSAVERTDATAPIVNTIQFRDTGVILEVTPRVNQSGMVQLDITQEISDVTATTTSDIDSPTIQQRKFTSSVSVADGETIALGGLIRDRQQVGRSGIPVLSDVPLLGNLFSSNSNNSRRTEILVLITPRVVQSMDDVRAVTNALRREILSNDYWDK